MSYFKLYKKSFEILLRSKSIWVLSLIYFLFNLAIQIGENSQENAIYLYCVLLLTRIISLYVTTVVMGGMIHIAYQAIYGNRSSFDQAWSVGKINVKPMIGLFLYMIPPGLLILFFGFLWYKNPDSLWLTFIIFLTATFFGSVFTFGDCNIILRNLKPKRAAKDWF